MLALPLQGISLGKQKPPLLVRVPGRHEIGRFLKMLRGVEVMQPCHRDVATHSAVGCGAEQTLVGGRLGLLRELLGLVRCRDFRLLGLAYQLIGFVEVTGLEGGIGARNEIARDRVLRIERL